MTRQPREFHERLARALGAEASPLPRPAEMSTPLDWLALREEVRARLRSSGGRPTDPDWELTRCIRFDREHWRLLERIAETLGRDGARVSAGQVAAILLEKAIERAAKAMGA